MLRGAQSRRGAAGALTDPGARIGAGANTALRDADLLRRNLITAGPHVTVAVADYERQMLGDGFAAVAQSLRNARFAASGNPIVRRVMRGALRAVNLVPPVKRRMLGD